MFTLTPVPPMPEVTIPLNLLIPSGYEHYFNRAFEGCHYTCRAFTFRGEPLLMPMVHAFLDTCAAAQGAEYRFLFDLLGSELVANALTHTRSGLPGETYTLRVDRSPTGMTLTCRDGGELERTDHDHRDRSYLASHRFADRLAAETGRGLALVDSIATSWGDNGFRSHRQVWFHLAYDLSGSAWPHV
ncbi:ATP-binding protein [Nocardiopsis ansamitocini]|uniref:Histidine kinase/HSP90-like ATPase domain-containing protein n=1 Tax=Nocardiopsis ansamitocini TaxID=1670832 RepID=A0A9W6P2G9_9ACTN|nr:ATP-binding protein [Nocardiopsis ansamitocini]GLU45891.1 hypothetical protein Nans01_02420 [Nocardiopsis ansamitocini]